MPSDQKTARVFVSSTAEDLKEFREAAQQALLDSDCHPFMFEPLECGEARTASFAPLLACDKVS